MTAFADVSRLTPADREVLAMKSVFADFTVWRRGTRKPIVLVASPANNGANANWIAGSTPAAPTAADPSAGEYSTGPEPGHVYPYMSPGATMPNNAGTAFWPECAQNQGINHYRRAIPFRRGMLGRRGGVLHVFARGFYTKSSSAQDSLIEFALQPNLVTAWNAGAGGDLSSTNSFFFRTPTIAAATTFTNNPWYLNLFMCCSAPTVLVGGFEFVCTTDASAALATAWSAPTVRADVRYAWNHSFTGFTWEENEGNLAFLFKTDRSSQANVGVLGSNALQDATEAVFSMTEFTALLYPGS